MLDYHGGVCYKVFILENTNILQRLNCSNRVTPHLFQHCGGRHSHLLFCADIPCLQIKKTIQNRCERFVHNIIYILSCILCNI